MGFIKDYLEFTDKYVWFEIWFVFSSGLTIALFSMAVIVELQNLL